MRFLHLFQSDFQAIHELITEYVEQGDWVLREKPKAYTWDPEAETFFNRFNLEVSKNDRHYTCVHYLVSPKKDSHIYCEIQVRTLFEEIWGEVDHQINYPTPTPHEVCKEQIVVLSKVVGAGSRLLESLNRANKIK